MEADSEIHVPDREVKRQARCLPGPFDVELVTDQASQDLGAPGRDAGRGNRWVVPDERGIGVQQVQGDPGALRRAFDGDARDELVPAGGRRRLSVATAVARLEPRSLPTSTAPTPTGLAVAGFLFATLRKCR